MAAVRSARAHHHHQHHRSEASSPATSLAVAAARAQDAPRHRPRLPVQVREQQQDEGQQQQQLRRSAAFPPRRQVRPPPQRCDSDLSIREHRSCSEVAGGTAAGCAAVCCCFPCVMVEVLVSGDHRAVKICDFGLAMSMSDAPPYEQAGTLSYKAPEMMLEVPDYDASVDVWSLGCVMAEIVNGKPLFQGCDGEDEQLCAIFEVLGMPEGETWAGFSSMPFATKVLPGLRVVHRKNRLRELFPEAALSREGFELLDGLLTCNPGKRLTADAALKHRWFAKVEALELPRKEEVASALPGKKVRAACAKRRKLQCA